jgi:Flp pilus assembly protein TadD
MRAALRATLLQAGLAAAGGGSIWAQTVYRAPQSWLTVLLAVLTLATTGLALALWVATVFNALAARPVHRRLVTFGYRACALAVLGFGLWGGFLFANGWLDPSPPVVRPARIAGIAAAGTELGRIAPFTWATVPSWRNAGGPERVLLRGDERWRLWGGQPVVLLVRRGFFGFPWIAAIEPDVDRQGREILAIVPEAAAVWRDLVVFNLRIGRLDEARRAASEYVTRFPGDPEFPVHVADILTARNRFPDVVALLTPVAATHQHAGAFMLLGHALGMQGQRAPGLSYLERAREMDPDNWWPHYALGWVHSAHGDTAGAVRAFDRARQLRPGLVDVEQQLARLRRSPNGRLR